MNSGASARNFEGCSSIFRSETICEKKLRIELLLGSESVDEDLVIPIGSIV
jgi:hypothetical protein